MLDSRPARILTLLSTRQHTWLLAAAVAAFAMGCGAQEDAGADNWASDTAQETDSVTTGQDTRQVPDAPQGDTTGSDTWGGDVGALNIIEVAMTAARGQEEEAAMTLVDGAPVDINGDGFLDLVGLVDNGDVVVKLMDPAARIHPPFVYVDPPQVITKGTHHPTKLATGDFDGDGMMDAIGFDPVAGGLSVLLNMGHGYLGPPIAFDDPIVMLEGAGDSYDWIIADFDGNGSDDVAFVGSSLFKLGLFGEPQSELSGPVEVAFGDLGLDAKGFDDPIVFITGGAALEIDGTPGAELVVAFDISAQSTGALEVIDLDLGAGFMGRDTKFDDPIVMLGRADIGPGGKDVVTADIDLDGIDDFAVLSSDGTSSTMIVFASGDKFDDPIVMFDDPIVFHGGHRATFEGRFSTIESSRMLTALAEGLGSGFAVPGNEMSMQLVARDPNGSDAVVLDFANPDLRLVRVTGSESISSATAADFNGDGIAEFLRAGSNGFEIVSQIELALDGNDEDAAALPAPNFDGKVSQPVCEYSNPYCSDGSRGVCEDARATCGGTCDGIGDGYDDFEAGVELSCDGVDNDCDGRVDVLSDDTLTLTGLPTDAPVAEFEVVASDTAAFAVLAVDGGTGLYVLAAQVPTSVGTSSEAVATLGMTASSSAAVPLLVSLDGSTLHVVVDDGATLQHATMTAVDQPAQWTAVTGVPNGFAVADMGIVSGRPVVLSASGGEVSVNELSTGASYKVLDLVGAVSELTVRGEGASLYATVKTGGNRFLVVELVDDNGVMKIRDMHQPALPTPGAAVTELTSDHGAGLGCVAYVETAEQQDRLRVVRMDQEQFGLVPHAPETLSLRAIVDGSVRVAATSDGCQVTWSELIPGVSIVLARAALADGDLRIQELNPVPASTSTALVAGVASTWFVHAPDVVSGTNLTVAVTSMCGTR